MKTLELTNLEHTLLCQLLERVNENLDCWTIAEFLGVDDVKHDEELLLQTFRSLEAKVDANEED